MRFLGVDVGGTSTRAVVVATDGEVLGHGAAGSGNPTASGVEAAAAAIAAAGADAIAQAGVTVDDVVLGVAGIAGAGGSPGARLRAALPAAGLTVTMHFEGDLLAAFCSGSLERSGYVLVSGTGAVAARVVAGRLDDVRDGLGWLLGDRGSGFWIGRRVVRRALAALDQRLEWSPLVDLLLAELGVDGEEEPRAAGRSYALHEVTDRLYRLRPADLARFAPLAFTAAAHGDVESSAIIGEAATELALTLRGVLGTGLDDPNGLDGPIVLGGSILSGQPSMVAAVMAQLADVTEVVTVSDGIVGAAVLALRHGGVDVDRDVRDRIRSSLDRLR